MLHDGHRERLRERFFTSPESFADHELIELLLFYSITRQNTNESAHELLNKFGSIKGILDAGFPALVTTEGIGEKSALFIRVISELLSRYEKEKFYSKTPLESPIVLSSFLKSLFVGTTNEQTYLLCFDSSKKLILYKKIAEGYSCGNIISAREIAAIATANNAAGIILAHNHPNGKAIPSGEDIKTTNILKSALETLCITFIEHFIVTDTQCCPIMNSANAKIYNTTE